MSNCKSGAASRFRIDANTLVLFYKEIRWGNHAIFFGARGRRPRRV